MRWGLFGIIITGIILILTTFLIGFEQPAITEVESQSAYSSLRAFSTRYGLEIRYSISRRFIVLHNANIELYLLPDSNVVLSSEGKIKYLTQPISWQNGTYYVPANELSGIFTEAVSDSTQNYRNTQNYSSSSSNNNTPIAPHSWAPIKYIVLDAGHGGRDPGNVPPGTSVYEKTITLTLCRQIKEKLQAILPDIQVIMTRDDDSFPELRERTEIASNYISPTSSAVFISVHANATLNRNSYGMEVYHYSNRESVRSNEIQDFRKDSIRENYANQLSSRAAVRQIISSLIEQEITDESRLLATNVHGKLWNQIGSYTIDRGVKQARFQVISYINMPSILVEAGFMTNSRELDNLRSSWYQDKCAFGVAQGIKDFIQNFNQSYGMRRE